MMNVQCQFPELVNRERWPYYFAIISDKLNQWVQTDTVLLFKPTDVVIVAVVVASEGKGNIFIFIGSFYWVVLCTWWRFVRNGI